MPDNNELITYDRERVKVLPPARLADPAEAATASEPEPEVEMHDAIQTLKHLRADRERCAKVVDQYRENVNRVSLEISLLEDKIAVVLSRQEDRCVRHSDDFVFLDGDRLVIKSKWDCPSSHDLRIQGQKP